MAIAGIALGLAGVAFLILGVVIESLGWMSMPAMDGMMNGDHGH